LNVEAASRILHAERHLFPNEILKRNCRVGIEETDIPFAIVRKKGTQEVNFVPIPSFPEPVGGVLEWIEYIVKVYKCARRQSGKNLEH
jgi:hypothetical protein